MAGSLKPKEFCVTEDTTTADRNARLREKIDAAKARTAEIAGDSAKTVKTLVEEHPVAMMAGGILLGALIARAIPRAQKKKASKRLSSLAALGTELALASAAKAAEAGKDGVHKLEDIGGSVGGKISEGGAEAKKRAFDLADIAMAGAREAGEAALRRANEFASRIRH